eukprot:Rmarinus@m.8363
MRASLYRSLTTRRLRRVASRTARTTATRAGTPARSCNQRSYRSVRPPFQKRSQPHTLQGLRLAQRPQASASMPACELLRSVKTGLSDHRQVAGRAGRAREPVTVTAAEAACHCTVLVLAQARLFYMHRRRSRSLRPAPWGRQHCRP